MKTKKLLNLFKEKVNQIFGRRIQHKFQEILGDTEWEIFHEILKENINFFPRVIGHRGGNFYLYCLIGEKKKANYISADLCQLDPWGGSISFRWGKRNKDGTYEIISDVRMKEYERVLELLDKIKKKKGTPVRIFAPEFDVPKNFFVFQFTSCTKKENEGSPTLHYRVIKAKNVQLACKKLTPDLLMTNRLLSDFYVYTNGNWKGLFIKGKKHGTTSITLSDTLRDPINFCLKERVIETK